MLKEPKRNLLKKTYAGGGNMTFFDHFFEMLKIKSFSANITFGERKVVENDRKVLAEKLYDKVSDTKIKSIYEVSY